MPTCFPSNPEFCSPAERAVWSKLYEQLGPDDVLVANFCFTDHSQDYELDLIVGLPGAGIVVIEVKGGEVRRFGREWHQLKNTGGKGRRVRPLGQAAKAKYRLRDRFYQKSAEGKQLRDNQARWAHAVVLPECEVHKDDLGHQTPSWLVFDRRDMDTLGNGLRRMLARIDDGRRPADRDHVRLLLDYLAERGRAQRDVLALADLRNAQQDTYTKEQSKFLDAAAQQHRLEITGGAGCGKTWLAVEQARRLAADGQRVALLCYSKGLARYLNRLAHGFPEEQRPAYVGTFHAYGRSRGIEVPFGIGSEPDWWEKDFPDALIRVAAELPKQERFDAVVLDESQDFSYLWWQALLSLLRERRSGGLYVFTDAGQRVFDRLGETPEGLVELRLHDNMRNTRQIAHVFEPLVAAGIRPCDIEGPPVEFVPTQRAEETVRVADDQVAALIERGWQRSDIAVLTTGAVHPRQKQNMTAQDWDAVWDRDEVFYGHVRGFKGLERRVIVLALTHRLDHRHATELTYVGLSRARDQLIVCGNPKHVAATVGAEVTRRLNVAAA